MSEGLNLIKDPNSDYPDNEKQEEPFEEGGTNVPIEGAADNGSEIDNRRDVLR